jgi:hypothetical protein
MKLDDLIESGPEVFEAMSDKDIEDFFSPLLTLTRPDEKMLKAHLDKMHGGMMPLQQKAAVSSKVIANAKAVGIDLGSILKTLKKRK